MEKKNKKAKSSVLEKTEYLIKDTDTNRSDRIIADPLGSYTGIAVNKNEKPTQDADDL